MLSRNAKICIWYINEFFCLIMFISFPLLKWFQVFLFNITNSIYQAIPHKTIFP